MRLDLRLGADSYPIFIQRGGLAQAESLLNLDRKVLIVTDRGVPGDYVERFAAQCGKPVVQTLPQGEGGKTMDSVTSLCRVMLENGFSRKDCVAAVGGGMCGDLAGFAAACFMRGIDFYNVPTTLLSQVDSSIGGKTGVNLDGVKNIVGAFWQPKGVVIDPDTLSTLPRRLWAEGMAEAVKMALTSDKALFEALEQGRLEDWPEELIFRALTIKKGVVEQDEREAGPRRLLNFGHTIGHGVESAAGGELFHGECVAIGMLPMCGEDLRPRLAGLLEKWGLPTRCDLPGEAVWQAMTHDKKAGAAGFAAVFVDRPGEGYVKQISHQEMAAILDRGLQA